MRDQFLTIDGFNIRYRDTGGSGPTLLCLHGIGGCAEFWTRQLEGLSDRYRVIAVDLPGHGLSDLGKQPYEPADFRDFCWSFLDALGIEKVTVLGNSMGGGIAVLMAGAKPERTNAIVLAGAATLGRRAPGPFRAMTLPFLGELMTKPSAAGVAQQAKAIFFDPAVVTAEIRAWIGRNVAKPGGAAAFLATLRLITDLGGQREKVVKRALDTLASLNTPVLFIHGKQDSVVHADSSIAAHKRTPNGKIILLDQCGHTPQWERPAEFNKAVTDFLERGAS